MQRPIKAKTGNIYTQTNHSQVKTPRSPQVTKFTQSNAFQSLTQKINEISEFEHNNYFQESSSPNNQMKKIPEMIQFQPPPIQEVNQKQQEQRIRMMKTPGEGARKQGKIYKSQLKYSSVDQGQGMSQSGANFNMIAVNKYNSQVIINKNQPPQQINTERLQDNNKQMNFDNNRQTLSTKSLKYNLTGNNFFKSINHNFSPLNEMDYQDTDFPNFQIGKRKVVSRLPNYSQSSTQFYHLKTVGFKNYKYPRPPQADQIYSSDNSKHRVPLNNARDPIRGGDSNSIESVCVQKVQQDKYIFQSLSDSIKDPKEKGDFTDAVQQNNNFLSSMDDDLREIHSRQSNIGFNQPYGQLDSQQQKLRRMNKYENKLLFEMDSYNRMLNLHNLELKIEQKNNTIHRNIFSRWKQRDSNPNLNSYTSTIINDTISPKSLIPKSHNPNLKIVQIDKIEMNSNLIGDRSKIKTSMQAVRINQQSKSKKLTTIIEMYNNLVRISEKYRQNGMILEGESPTKQNKMKLLELADESKTKIFKNKQEIYLGVFIQNYDILKQNKQEITQRILYALGLEFDKEFSYVSLEQIIAFYRILIHRDSAISETIKFLEKFFKQQNQDINQEEFKKIIKQLCSQTNDKRAEYQKNIYEYLIDSFESNGVIDQNEDVVNFKKFKQIFTNNTLNIYDIIDLICGIRD